MIELLSPAGDLDKLKYAVKYGADAVYVGGENFSMRAKSTNFTNDHLQKGIDFAHENNVLVYVAVNVSANNEDINPMLSYIKSIAKMGADGIIVSDPGIIYAVKNELPEIYTILSTQANTTNSTSLSFWKNNGVDRVVLARELSLTQIQEISNEKPEGMQIEVFVHGAMCISYSGRCLLSNYLTTRDSNKGDCAQPCRWRYSLVEQTRDGEYFDIEEDSNTTYIFNSKDLCLIEHIPELIDAGVDSIKIEGRMKSVYYTAVTTKAYRSAIDQYIDSSRDKEYHWEDLYEELEKVSHRKYTKAFFLSNQDHTAQNYGSSSYLRTYDFVAKVLESTDQKTGLTKLMQVNKFSLNEKIEIISPNKEPIIVDIISLLDENMEHIETAPHPAQIVYLKTNPSIPLDKFDLLRRKRNI